MNEPCGVKISAFPIYRFFRNGLPAMTKAGLACVVAFGLLAFVIFSPGFSFRMPQEKPSRAASVNFAEGYAEAAFFKDSEPLFLPTRWNFGAEISPKELRLREPSFLPFGELFLATRDAASAMPLKYAQTPPRAEDALGADAWAIARGFGTGTPVVPAAPEAAQGNGVRVVDAVSGETLFAGTLDVSVDDARTLFAPAEYFCGLAFAEDAPHVLTVRSCGSTDADARVAEAVAALMKSLAPGKGIFRIFVELR